MNETKIDSAIELTSSVRNDLFDHVALSLSTIEGKLKFLQSENLQGESRFSDDFSEEVAQETLQNVQKTRKALDEIFANLNKAKNTLLFS
tara:strand:+ start:315 stop:584 length:270 start_codon:yes stop_codon:yes gene_type:complete